MEKVEVSGCENDLDILLAWFVYPSVPFFLKVWRALKKLEFDHQPRAAWFF